MLLALGLQNLATIERIEIGFGPGLNALTGETGAGKSIMIGGLELALGERAAATLLRPGARLAVAEAQFAAPGPGPLRALLTGELGLELDAGEPLVLRRELAASGRSRAFINGQLVAVSDLKRAGELLLDLHGQHEHQSLFQPDAARRALDAYADAPACGAAYTAAWERAAHLRRRAAELAQAAAEHERLADYLDFQLAEFEQLQPQAGELEALASEERRLAHGETLARAAAEAYALLYDGTGADTPPVLGQLREVQKRAAELAHYDAALAELSARLEEHRTGLGDLAITLRDYTEQAQADPERLNQVIARLEALRKLVRKHGGSEAALLQAWAALRAERARLTRDDTERRTMAADLDAAEAALRTAGAALTAARMAAAGRFAAQVQALLRELKMERARFELRLEPLAEPASHGLDAVEFLLAANAGLPPAPLRKIGSGGELSRVMLAIKSVLAARDHIPTLVFDEIDAGISGETARRVGRALEKLAGSHQVLVITHHAAIAARAAHHVSVRKLEHKRETFTEAQPVAGAARLEELARMMGGELAAPAARELARELMEK